eukprot:403355857
MVKDDQFSKRAINQKMRILEALDKARLDIIPGQQPQITSSNMSSLKSNSQEKNSSKFQKSMATDKSFSNTRKVSDFQKPTQNHGTDINNFEKQNKQDLQDEQNLLISKRHRVIQEMIKNDKKQMISDVESELMNRRLSNYDNIILAQPLTQEVRKILKSEDRRKKLQSANIQRRSNRLQSGKNPALIHKMQEQIDEDTFFITNVIKQYSKDPSTRLLPNTTKNDPIKRIINQKESGYTNQIPNSSQRQQNHVKQPLKITMEESQNDTNDDELDCDLSDLSFELFHKNELDAIKKIQNEKKKIFYNEKIRTTNYVISSKFEKRNELLDQELEQAQRELTKKNNMNQSYGSIGSRQRRIIKRESDQTAKQQTSNLPQDFKAMKLQELIQHENGILNLINAHDQNNLEGDLQNCGEKGINQQLLKCLYSNTQREGSSNGFKITKEEYESIFQHNPTFYERKAFVDIFRKKWKGSHSYNQKLQNQSELMKQQEEQMFHLQIQNNHNDQQNNLALIPVSQNMNLIQADNASSMIYVVDERPSRPKTESGARPFRKKSHLVLSKKKNTLMQDTSTMISPQKKLEQSAKELKKIQSNIALEGYQAQIQSPENLSEFQTKQEVQRLLSSHKLIKSPKSQTNIDFEKQNYNNRSHAILQSQERRKKSSQKMLGNDIQQQAQILSEEMQLQDIQYKRNYTKKGIIGEIVHQIRIDTPDSNSSKTLVRTFESITTKNENMRQHPRYEGLNTQPQFNNNSITLDGNHSKSGSIANKRYSMESQNDLQDQDMPQLVPRQSQSIENGQIIKAQNDMTLSNNQSTIRESNPIHPFVTNEESRQNQKFQQNNFYQISSKEVKFNGLNDIKLNKSFNVNLIRNRKEIERRMKLEQVQYFKVPGKQQLNINGSEFAQGFMIPSQYTNPTNKLRTEVFNSPSNQQISNPSSQNYQTFHSQSGYINKQRKLRQKEILSTLINMNLQQTKTKLALMKNSQEKDQGKRNQSLSKITKYRIKNIPAKCFIIFTKKGIKQQISQ